jgi:hypothetical protein
MPSPIGLRDPSLDGGWPLEFFLTDIKVRVSRYRKLIPDLQDKMTQRQLVCPRLEDISNFIEARIVKLCNIESEFFCPEGFRSKYELRMQGQGSEILVHDKVLDQVEPLFHELLKDWENKSLEMISAGMEKIGQLCKVQNVLVDRSVQPHRVKTEKGAPQLLLDMDDMDDMDEANHARPVDLA